MMKLALMTAGAGLTTIMAICHGMSHAKANDLPPTQVATAFRPAVYSMTFVEGAEAEPPAWPPNAQGQAASLEPAAGLSLASLDTPAPQEKVASPDASLPKLHQRHHRRKNITFARAGDGSIVPIMWNR